MDSAMALSTESAVQVNIKDGSVADAYLLEDDFVHTSHNFGIHVWDDLLLLVGVRCNSVAAVTVAAIVFAAAAVAAIVAALHCGRCAMQSGQ